MRKRWLRSIAVLTAFTICLSGINMHVQADNSFNSPGMMISGFGDANGSKTDIVEKDSLKVTFSLTNVWNGGYNAEIKLKNTGSETIQNWLLEFAFSGEISNLWNAQIVERDGNFYRIKNIGWNQDIPAGAEVSFGFSSQQSFPGFPENYQLAGSFEESMSEEAYAVKYQVTNDWGAGFTAEITLSNTSDTALEDWVLSFDYAREITTIWSGVITQHEGTHYIIRSAGYNSNIPAGQSITFGFNGSSGSAADVPQNVVLSSWSAGAQEPQPVSIQIDTSALMIDETMNCYNLTENFENLTGSLENKKAVRELTYEVKDLKGNTVEGGDIPVSDHWDDGKIGLGIGYNEITVSAVTKGGETVREKIEVFNTRFDNLSEKIDMDDDDGDGIPNYTELYFGTDKNVSDTDGDGLSDYYELMLLGTDPLKRDTDENGIPDGDEDPDEDGLTNIRELSLQTDPSAADTDEDGLLDGNEVDLYYTDPLQKDSDGDGVSDGKEIQLHTDPAQIDEQFPAAASAAEENLTVSVETVLSGEQYGSLNVCRYDNDFLFPEDMPGYIGGAYEFSVEGSFETATIRFTFDDSLLYEEDFDPVIYYYNESEQRLEELPTVVHGNTASAQVTHFSKYILLDRHVFQNAFTWQDVWTGERYVKAEIVLLIDDSGWLGGLGPHRYFDASRGYFTSGADPDHRRLEAAKALVDLVSDETRIAIVKSDSRVENLTGGMIPCDETGKAALKDILKITAPDGTDHTDHPGVFDSAGNSKNFFRAIEQSVDLFSADSEEVLKVILVITGGLGDVFGKYQNALEKSVNSAAKVFIVNLNTESAGGNDLLQEIAEKTGGEMTVTTDRHKMPAIVKDFYKKMSQKMDLDTDSDHDGIPDYYEDHFPMFNGKEYKLNKFNPDTDGDGVPDGQEVKIIKKYSTDGKKIRVEGIVHSDPCDGDRDGDGILDKDDPKPLEHFGLLDTSNGKVLMFETSRMVKEPRNSIIEQEIAWETDGHTYRDAFNVRAAKLGVKVESSLDVLTYLTGIRVRAWSLTYPGTLFGDDTWAHGEQIGNILTLTNTSGIANFLLKNYLNSTGYEVQYDPRDFLTKTEDGKTIYQKCIKLAMKACENGTVLGTKLTFIQKDGAVKRGNSYITEQYLTPNTKDVANLHPIISLQQWLGFNQTFSALSGECIYDGEYYNLELEYFLQDYYDWYYPDETDGKNRLLLVTCDEMCWLHLFAYAKNFKSIGIQRVLIRWKKGDSYEQAEQYERDFEPYKR